MNITLKRITKTYGDVAAAADVSLEIRDGETFFLLGPSGCGKTTLLRIVAGFCAPDSGVVLFDGVDVTARPPHERRTGMVFQNYALWPHMTVEANVAFGLTVPGRQPPAEERRRRVREALCKVRLVDQAERTPTQLSGGQQQRVALARALVINPDCLLLDEPLSNLDAKLRLDMRIEIRRLVKELGITTLYVTHDQKEALSMADRCAVLNGGRVEQVGVPRALYERPVNRFTADFLGGANLIPGSVTAVRDGRLTVNTGFGVWECAAFAKPFAVGARVTLSVRPESLVLTPGSGTPGFPAVIRDVLYLGETAEYRLTAANGTELKALEMNPRWTADARPADVRFSVDPTAVVALPADSNSHDGKTAGS
ncbi:MAG: ABC transporter ATP-binding protein [Lentisphaerae bacterium]|nr:ABC transporter ATP-binding protein [Lentisphaerota bacterium]